MVFHRRSLLRVTQPFVSAAGITFSLAYTATKTDTSTNATVTYNGGGDPSCGAADANRIVAVGVFRRITTTNPPSSVTIGGVAATQATGAFVQRGGVIQTDIWYAAVPAGTTCTVVVAWDAGASVFSDSAIAVYRVITGTPTPSAVSNGSGAAAAGSMSITSYTVPTGGKSMNVYGHKGGVNDVNPTWVNATLDANTIVNSREFSAATVASAGSVSVSITNNTAGPEETVASAAAWGP